MYRVRTADIWSMPMKEPTVTKKALLKGVEDLPERMPVDEVIDRIVLLSKIERGLKTLQLRHPDQRVQPTNAMTQRLRLWVESANGIIADSLD